ncbi:hypothetical protein KI387_016819, partial [Taxus chinensis]
TADEWWDLIHRVCTNTLMIPMERTRAELSWIPGSPQQLADILTSFPPYGTWPGWYRLSVR